MISVSTSHIQYLLRRANALVRVRELPAGPPKSNKRSTFIHDFENSTPYAPFLDSIYLADAARCLSNRLLQLHVHEFSRHDAYSTLKSRIHRKTSTERTKLERAQNFENLDATRSPAVEFSQTSPFQDRKIPPLSSFATTFAQFWPQENEISSTM